jgi:hypothetical protein
MSRMHPEAHRVEVEWEDSTLLPDGWMAHREVMQRRKRAVRCLSVGLLIADDKLGVTLASSAHGNDLAGVTVIPRSQVRRTRRLR